MGAVMLLTGVFEAGAEEALWLRSNSISPDGTKIAFSWQGDIFVVPTGGGLAVQLTTNPAFETSPIWTADGKNIVFCSMREKSKDIFVIPAEGGTPKQLTTWQGTENLLAVLSDGTVLFTTNILPDAQYSGFPNGSQIYSVPLTGGKPRLVYPMQIGNLSVNGSGQVLYEDYKGYEDPFRKHHTSSVTRDIWLYTPAADSGKGGKNSNEGFSINAEGTFTKLSTFEGEDRNPVFAPDGDTYYYISERSGSMNVWKSNIGGGAKEEQVTFFDTHPVRYLSISGEGTLSFSYNGELYTLKNGGQPVKITVDVVKDKAERDVEKHTVARLTPTSFAPSPNGKEVAVVVRGDVYVTAIDYATTRRITDTPEQERDVCFSKDGKTLYYSSERNGHWGIYAASLTEKDDKYFTYSTRVEETLVTEPGQTCFDPHVSPDGKSLAFFRDRTEIVVRDIKSGNEKTVLKGALYSYQDGDLSFEWSPDSNYILSNYAANGGWNNVDVALIDVNTGEITDLTESGYSDRNMKWALKGKAMTWETDKYGYRSHGSWGAENDILIMFFDGKAHMEFLRDKEDRELEKMLKEDTKEGKKEEKEEAKDSVKAEKKVEKLVLDLENRYDRIKTLTKYSGRIRDYHLTEDGTKLFYIVQTEKSMDLCVMDMEKGDIKTVSSSAMGSLVPSADGKSLFLVKQTGVDKIDINSEKPKPIQFSGEYDYQPAKEREYIFNHIWKQVAEKFYDPELHGIDWEGYREAYRRFLPHINNNNDFAELLSEMLGELNGSHTGARYRVWGGGAPAAGRLGVLYDDSYEGEGLKIKEVLAGGVLAIADNEIKAGDVITSINGKKIEAGTPWYIYLEGLDGKRIPVTVSKGGKEVELFVKPASARTENDLLLRRWVRGKEEMVERLSGGRVGYVYVESMDSKSFREVYSKLLGKYRACEAVIVDTRHNGGGWLHDALATLLSGKAYIDYTPRGQYMGTEPYNKWTKPSCVLMGEDNYSDACGFPYTYRTLGIGKLIGAPVPGTMTAVWWENQIDPTIVFGIPQVGSVGLKEGRYLENLQIEPDVLVYNDPASELRGEDKQLEAAVEEMLKEIGTK
ncbi:MAG: S41 family peptidase [Bacteroidales bacterium]|nr:S41 family peptidase [Bacteroidales bacterium]